MNVVDRILRTTWNLVLLLLVLSILLPVAGKFFAHAITSTTGAVAETLGPLVGSGVVGVLFVVFLVGLGIRAVRSVGDPAAARKRAVDRDRLRRSPRHHAEDIPPYGEARRAPPEEDPTLPFGGA